MIFFEDTYEYETIKQTGKFNNMSRTDQCYYLANLYKKIFDIKIEYDVTSKLELFNGKNIYKGDVIRGIYVSPDIKCDLIFQNIHIKNKKYDYSMIIQSNNHSNTIPISKSGLPIVVLYTSSQLYIQVSKPTQITIWYQFLPKHLQKEYSLRYYNSKYDDNIYINCGLITTQKPDSCVIS
jgi:hypothetical protein